jgi:hypothetical protein
MLKFYVECGKKIVFINVKIFKKVILFFRRKNKESHLIFGNTSFVVVALVGKDIVFRFIIEYSSLRDFGP